MAQISTECTNPVDNSTFFMLWQRKQKWHYFDTGLMAQHFREADFLQKWYFHKSIKGELAANFEVIDLQRYKIVSKANKVNIAMREKANEPFIFFACRN